MATRTLGTAGTGTLTTIRYQRGPNVAPATQELAADFATIANGILDDGQDAVGGPVDINNWRASNTKGPYPGAFGFNGLLYVPNRGVLKVIPGDFVAFDTQTGWPILVSGAAAAGAGWVHT